MLLQTVCAGLDGKSARHLRHRDEQGEGAVGTLHGLVGDSHYTRLHKGLCLCGIGGQMKIRVEDLTLTQEWVLRCERFLDLPDHVGPAVDLFGSRYNFCPDGNVFLVGKP